MALEDAQGTVGLVRFHAAEYHYRYAQDRRTWILCRRAPGGKYQQHFDKRLYPAVDAADKVSCRPDFAVALYPGHLWISKQRSELNPDIPVSRRTPPTFFAAGLKRSRGQC